ncbi:MAG: hypothetical protein V2A73_17430 [Pseudomonadota bacterium]
MADTWMVEVFCAELGEYELLSGLACLTREQARDEIAEERKKSPGLKLRAVRYVRKEGEKE